MSAADFKCRQCGRSFNRREHLERHCRTRRSNQTHSTEGLGLTSPTDSKEKPFTCPVCAKGFARRDVYHRHIRIHSPSVAVPLLKRQNALTACDACHDRKVKCHPSERPCPRCRMAGRVCEFRQKQAPGLNSASSVSEPLSFPSMEQATSIPIESDATLVDSIVGLVLLTLVPLLFLIFYSSILRSTVPQAETIRPIQLAHKCLGPPTLPGLIPLPYLTASVSASSTFWRPTLT